MSNKGRPLRVKLDTLRGECGQQVAIRRSKSDPIPTMEFAKPLLIFYMKSFQFFLHENVFPLS